MNPVNLAQRERLERLLIQCPCCGLRFHTSRSAQASTNELATDIHAAEDVVDPRNLSEIDDPHDLPPVAPAAAKDTGTLPLVALGPDSIDQISVDLRRRAIVMTDSHKAVKVLMRMMDARRAQEQLFELEYAAHGGPKTKAQTEAEQRRDQACDALDEAMEEASDMLESLLKA